MDTPGERPTARRRPPPLPTRPPTRKVPRPQPAGEEEGAEPRARAPESQPAGGRPEPGLEERLGRRVEERLGRLVEERLGRLVEGRLGRLVEERLGRLVEERLGRLVEERLGRLVEERLGPAIEERLAQLGLGSSDEPGAETTFAQRVEEALSGLDGRVGTLEARERERSHAERCGPSLDERVEGALRAALERLDLQEVAERVAIVATGPLMQAIDGRLEELERGRPA